MNDQLKTSYRLNYEASHSVTSSPALESGLTLSDWLESETIAPCGPALVRVNLSARQAKEAGLLTSGTYGPHGSISFENAGLARYLESKWRAKMASHGSTLFALTCKERVTPAGAAIFALRASARRISDNGYSSWPTPMAGSPASETYNEAGNSDYSRKTVALASWPTPKASDCQGGRTTETAGGGNAHLDRDVRLASWATPKSHTVTGAASRAENHKSRLEDQVFLSSWATPAHRDCRYANAESYAERGGGSKGEQLNNQVVHLTQVNGPARLTAIGILLTGSSARMASGGQLNPEHSRWLQGVLAAWENCAPTETRSALNKRKSLSKPFLKASDLFSGWEDIL